MFSFILLVVSADFSPQSSLPRDEVDRQRALLKMFFADVTPQARARLSASCPDDREDYLRWTGVLLKDGLVVSVVYNNHIDIEKLGNCNIHALPNSTKRIGIMQCQQKYAIQTRLLPRDLEFLMVSRNLIFGTIDLTRLPENLQGLDAMENNIWGPIDLTQLPRKLVNLSLLSNKIDQKVVLYGNLPPAIELIGIGYQRSTEGIGAVRPISKSDKLSKEKAHEVFMNLKHLDPWPENDEAGFFDSIIG